MADFEVNITAANRAEKLQAVTMARELINAGMPDVLDGSGQPILPNPNHFATDEAYINHVVDKAAESYAKSFGLIENNAP